ncbi:iron-siderophore ABC transporter substrate-binding protein [Kineococcus arenarius]|uniref:iron-siderophore ABC transporter substrate-binding protein n=1 Tax=unclassified Kineococcus TaxID=2621656 RepID=UPI003D7C5835
MSSPIGALVSLPSRRALLASTSITGLAALTACSSESGGGAGTATPSAAGSASAGTVETLFGTVELPEEPQRVVALGWGDAETCLALGTQVVGTSDWLAFGGDGVGPWADDLVTQTPEQLGTLELSYEAVAALQPDLILNTRSDNDPAKNENLTEIATTVGPPPGTTIPYGTSWQEQLALVATALGKADQGDELASALQLRFDEVAAAHPQFAGRTVTVGTYYSGGWGAYVEGDTRVDFMTALGFVQNPAVAALPTDSFSVSLSAEQLSLLDADLVVLFPIGLSAEEITADPVVQALPATQDGRLVVLDDPAIVSAFSSGTTLGLGYALDEAVPLFAQALPA